jgi:hypothetical protein
MSPYEAQALPDPELDRLASEFLIDRDLVNEQVENIRNHAEPAELVEEWHTVLGWPLETCERFLTEVQAALSRFHSATD